ncbi:hypothetical protein [Chryseobacterium taichungense]|uniref:hypothetical protein n=1 Tax=Chryseobacterium taichungense TaxID=295069 RepID=UPI0028A824BC|nr:hypothetical protein [Chryseobacterium taichungense]
MGRDDYKNIKKLIERNEYFYQKKSINNIEYSRNNLLFIDKLDKILDDEQRIVVKDFLIDEYSIAKFKLSIDILKAEPN